MWKPVPSHPSRYSRAGVTNVISVTRGWAETHLGPIPHLRVQGARAGPDNVHFSKAPAGCGLCGSQDPTSQSAAAGSANSDAWRGRVGRLPHQASWGLGMTADQARSGENGCSSSAQDGAVQMWALSSQTFCFLKRSHKSVLSCQNSQSLNVSNYFAVLKTVSTRESHSCAGASMCCPEQVSWIGGRIQPY